MVINKFLIALFLLFSAGNNLNLRGQESFDLEIQWQKEVYPKEIKFAHFSADGQWIYAATGAGIEKISAETGEFVSLFDNSGIVSSIWDMDMSVLGNLIVTRDGGGCFNIWDTRLEKATKYYQFRASDSSASVLSVAISPDEKFLVFCKVRDFNYPNTNNYDIVIYDLINETIIKSLDFDYAVKKIKFSHNGKYFATGGEYTGYWDEKDYDQVILWSTETWSPVDTIENLEGSGSGYRVIEFSNHDKYLGCVRITPWDCRIYNLDMNNCIFHSDNNIHCYNLAFLPDNEHFVVNYWNKGTGDILEVHNFNYKETNYNLNCGIMTTFNNFDHWKIFCTTTYYPMSMLKKISTEVETEPQILNNIIISQGNNNIILQTENIQENSLLLNIYDLRGTMVYTKPIITSNQNNLYSIPIDLISGIYICKVTSGNKSYTQKIEIVR